MNKSKKSTGSSSSKKSKPSDIEAVVPKSLEEALKLISKKRYLALAGGTNISSKLSNSEKNYKLISIDHLKEFNRIDVSENEVVLGSCVKISDILKNKKLKELIPILIDACEKLDIDQNKETSTIGGNIVSAVSKTEVIPALTNYGAVVVLESLSGTRKFAVNDFVIDASKTEIKKDELLTKVIIPLAC